MRGRRADRAWGAATRGRGGWRCQPLVSIARVCRQAQVAVASGLFRTATRAFSPPGRFGWDCEASHFQLHHPPVSPAWGSL
eukprot:scaffold10649_cov84-Isochrysis_galbana.AAC.1